MCGARLQVGFLADRRRLNVAITRAKRGLVVIGNAATLSSDPTWARWLDWATAKGCRLGAKESADLLSAARGSAAGAVLHQRKATAAGGHLSGQEKKKQRPL